MGRSVSDLQKAVSVPEGSEVDSQNDFFKRMVKIVRDFCAGGSARFVCGQKMGKRLG